MLFNTLEFGVFFVVVYALYLLLGHKGQNRMLLIASYLFYGTWDWRFVPLLLLTTAVDYFAALRIQRAEARAVRRGWLLLSIAANLGVLGFFKYYDFFLTNLQGLAALAGVSLTPRLLRLILPWGISFYTFQSMSYTIDVYRGELVPAANFLDFSLFVTYFPHLVAGPIMRATKLLPQVLAPRRVTLEGFYEGCYLFFWGLFQKVFIADNLARFVDAAFAPKAHYQGADVLCGVYAFAFQIYGDFAGYSNMARGLGKCMGFDIVVNFNLPYFAKNPREFWTRWHISLSTWFKDYLYIPLGGNRVPPLRRAFNLLIVFLVSGLWHGAGWMFLAWGLYHGLLLGAYTLIEPWLSRVPKPGNLVLDKAWLAARIVFFFHLTCVGWVFFRAPTLSQALLMLASVAARFGAVPWHTIMQLKNYVWLLLIVEVLQYGKGDQLFVFRSGVVPRAALYVACFLSLIAYGAWDARQFIYFQF